MYVFVDQIIKLWNLTVNPAVYTNGFWLIYISF